MGLAVADSETCCQRLSPSADEERRVEASQATMRGAEHLLAVMRTCLLRSKAETATQVVEHKEAIFMIS